MSLKCFLGIHTWDKCRCAVCGKKRDHDMKLVETTQGKEPSGCCWNTASPCNGPYCGTPCENWFIGRGGTMIEHYRCTRCGYEEQREVERYETEYRP